MTVKERLQQDAREAMRAREAGRLRLGVLRMALAAIQRVEVDERRAASDADAEGALARELRQRQDALREIQGRGRPEAEQQLQAEIEVLRAYLPAPLSPEEVDAAARLAVQEAGAASARDMGRVMALLMPRVRGRADGAAVQAAVRRILGGGAS